MKINKSVYVFVFVFLAFLVTVNALCCNSGCYSDANICCPPGDPDSEGYDGCVNANGQAFCPGQQIGECLVCQCNLETRECDWTEDTEGDESCNACVVDYNELSQPLNSRCDFHCPEGEVMCRDEICREDCGSDADNDGMPDEWEIQYFGDLSQTADGDYDGDGVTNLEEYLQGMDPTRRDTDNDGTEDGDDSDNDGMSDDWEQEHGLDPFNSADATQDPDGDGFTNLEEFRNGTDPHRWDGISVEGPGFACNFNGICDEGDSCRCGDCDYRDEDSCLDGLFCSEERKVCSGDFDGDGVLNDDDVCVDKADKDQLDEDGDCYLENGKRSPLFGYCGDECEGEGICESEYDDKQCCDNFPGTSGVEPFFGYTQDCPAIEGAIGCFKECVKFDSDGNVIKYEAGSCIEGTRVIKELTCNENGENCVQTQSWTENCMSIPLVPFFTNINILITLLILVGYYILKGRDNYE